MAMRNPFFALTEKSVDKPRTVLACLFAVVILLSSGAMHLKFDNSEDGFFPDNETVSLLNDIEDEYQASVDFVRIINEVEQGDLLVQDTWTQLAYIEAQLLLDENFQPYQYPLFGTQPNAGMASSVIQWHTLQDSLQSANWRSGLSNSIEQIRQSNSSTLTASLDSLNTASSAIPDFQPVTPERLTEWDFSSPESWLARIDSSADLSDELDGLIGQLASLMQENKSQQELGLIAANSGPIFGQLNMMKGLQDIDFREAILSNIPVDERNDPWNMSGPVITTLVISNDPVVHGKAATDFDSTQNDITKWSNSLVEKLQQDTGDDEIRSFSFAQFGVGSTETLGKEIGILTSSAFFLLALILWFNFRSKRETAYVMVLTIFAIAATYGLSGWLEFFGVNMIFNAAMNSIPVLLLAIGVDYGLHVVLRIREELKNSPEGASAETMRDFSVEARKLAIRRGTIFTSIALLIAIFTDVVGFLSFRFSALTFLQVFGTVIAIGLFFIYLLSISALPALMTLIPPKRLPLDKASKTEIGPVARGLGRLSMQPMKVGIIAVLLLIPMFIGFQQLEVGFEQRDQFDQSIPVVADFILLSDDFQSSRSPLYIVYDGDVLSDVGWESWNLTMSALTASPDITGVPNGLWDLIEESRPQYAALDEIMISIEGGESEGWNDLDEWLLTNETGRQLSSALLHSNGQQTLISFQANTLDWQATVDLNDRIEELLSQVEGEMLDDGTLKVSGRSLINAQTTSDVAASSIQSTAIVAIVILVMLVSIHSARQKNLVQGFARGIVSWIPLMMVVCWVYGIMGFTGYNINPQTVTIGALSLGLGVDYAVHFTTRLEEEVEHNPSGTQQQWVEKASATTGRAMFGAALTTAGGFAVLNLSALLPLKLFGQAFVVAITLALLSSLILLPAFYSKFLQYDAKKYLEEE
tara:strand:+ start:5323 stop:8100 length:2778 start_codon:yes stop_codon:yes gene_type:complete